MAKKLVTTGYSMVYSKEIQAVSIEIADADCLVILYVQRIFEGHGEKVHGRGSGAQKLGTACP